MSNNSNTAPSSSASSNPKSFPARHRIWELDTPSSSGPSQPRAQPIQGQAVQAQPVRYDVESPRFHFQSDDTLEALRSLPTEKTILLLTPVVPHPQDSPQRGENVDPFEVFGLALSKHHARIRHVPYVTDVGVTETHQVFLRKADAVIVVWCEPTAELTNHAQLHTFGPTPATKAFMGQSYFAIGARKALNIRGAQPSEQRYVPFILATTGPSGCLLDQGVAIHDFGTVIHCVYQDQALQQMADVLFDADLSKGDIRIKGEE